jgi:hypothetical protein
MESAPANASQGRESSPKCRRQGSPLAIDGGVSADLRQLSGGADTFIDQRSGVPA